MAHLSEAEFVDWVDGTLPSARASHVDTCATCRSQAERLRLDLTVIADRREPIPEPSPLFWDHLSQRVRESVRDVESAPRQSHWFARQLWTAVAGSAIALVVAIALWTAPRDPNPAERTQTSGSPAERQTLPAEPVHVALEEDQEWALVRTVADDLQWENAHEAGLSARPGAAERVALEMSPEERQELARLLEDDLKRTGA